MIFSKIWGDGELFNWKIDFTYFLYDILTLWLGWISVPLRDQLKVGIGKPLVLQINFKRRLRLPFAVTDLSSISITRGGRIPIRKNFFKWTWKYMKSSNMKLTLNYSSKTYYNQQLYRVYHEFGRLEYFQEVRFFFKCHVPIWFVW